MSVSSTGPIEVFFSYSHQDEKLRDELAKQLKLLERQGVISAWYDRQIIAGSEWGSEIDTHLDSAQVILLLISADFLASDYCWDIEVKRAMERHEAGEAIVIPVILRPVDWKGTPFSKLQALPKNAKPVTTWTNQDEAFLDAAKGIRQAVEQFAVISSNQTLQEKNSIIEDNSSLGSSVDNSTKSKGTLTSAKRQRLERQCAGLQQQYDLFSEKIERLREALAIEVDVTNSFKLEKQLEKAQTDQDKIRQQIEDLEIQLEQG